MVTPLTDLYLDWGEFENSLMYFSAGIEVIDVFVFFAIVIFATETQAKSPFCLLGRLLIPIQCLIVSKHILI